FEGESRKDIQLQQLELLHHMLSSGPFIIPPPVPSETPVCKVIVPTDPAGCYSITTLRKDGSIHGASFSATKQSKKKVYFSEVLNLALQSAPELDDFEGILEYKQTLRDWCKSLQHFVQVDELLQAYEDYLEEARRAV